MTLRRCCKQCNKPSLDRQEDGVTRFEELPVAKSGDHWHVPISSERRAKALESRPSADWCISLTRTAQVRLQALTKPNKSPLHYYGAQQWQKTL